MRAHLRLTPAAFIAAAFLTACGSGSPTSPSAPVLSVSPGVLEFTGTTSALQLTIANTGDQELEWEVQKNKLWLSASTYEGRTAPGASETVVISVVRGGISALPTSGTITVDSNGGKTAVLIDVE